MAGCKTKVIAVVGPTASGKTALAVQLAKEFGGEVISCDSMQIYRGMEIATAAPTAEETQGIPHHLVGIADPSQEFSVARFCALANEKIAEITARGKIPVIAGGTGLYFSSLIDNIDFPESPSTEKCRLELKEKAQKLGIEVLFEELKKIDPEAAQWIHPNNEVRVIRALEVYYTTGRTLTETKALSRRNESPLAPVIIGLDAKDRAFLYNRIDLRVDKMVQNGLVEEARRFYSLYDPKTAAQALGYKELLPFINGEAGLDDCLQKLKFATHRYAKRQLTWFRRDPRIHFLFIDEYSSPSLLFEAAKEYVKGASE